MMKNGRTGSLLALRSAASEANAPVGEKRNDIDEVGDVVVIDIDHLLAGFVAGLDRRGANTETGTLGQAECAVRAEQGRHVRHIAGDPADRATKQRTQVAALVIAGDDVLAPHRDSAEGLLIAVMRGAVGILDDSKRGQGGFGVKAEHLGMPFVAQRGDGGATDGSGIDSIQIFDALIMQVTTGCRLCRGGQKPHCQRQ
jgi:hypothetical protein